MSWPQEALISCCSYAFKELSYDQNIKKSLVDMCTQVQLDVEALTERFMMEVSRRIYVTPKSFLDMISLFLSLLKKKKGDFESNRVNYLLK
jgi:dynein heavy chain